MYLVTLQHWISVITKLIHSPILHFTLKSTTFCFLKIIFANLWHDPEWEEGRHGTPHNLILWMELILNTVSLSKQVNKAAGTYGSHQTCHEQCNSAVCVCVCVPLTAVAGHRGRQTPPWAGRWSYFHTARWKITTQTCFRRRNDKQVIYAHTHNLAQGPLTGSLGSAAPGRRQELSPRSGCCSGLCVGQEDHRISHGNGKKSLSCGRFDPTLTWVAAS